MQGKAAEEENHTKKGTGLHGKGTVRSRPCEASALLPNTIAAFLTDLEDARKPKKNYSHCLGLLEFSNLLDVVHEIPSIYVLHDKVETVLRRGEDREERGVHSFNPMNSSKNQILQVIAINYISYCSIPI